MSAITDPIAQAKADFLRAKEQMARALANTPDDRINWSPSPTARTPIQIVAHAAAAVENINEMLDGHPFDIGTTAEADKHFREFESGYTTRAQALELLNQTGDAYAAWLDALRPERLETLVKAPFGLGNLPVGAGLGFPAMQVSTHTAQIEYIQTIYGDRDWHM